VAAVAAVLLASLLVNFSLFDVVAVILVSYRWRRIREKGREKRESF